MSFKWSSSYAQTFFKTLSAFALMSTLIAAAIGFTPGFQTRADASSVCYDNYEYGGYETTNFSASGLMGDLNYAKNDMYLEDDSTDHAAMYFNNFSQADSGQAPYGRDWLQDGYFVGTVPGGETQDTTVVYGEDADINTGDAVDTFYPSLAWGTDTSTITTPGKRVTTVVVSMRLTTRTQ